MTISRGLLVKKVCVVVDCSNKRYANGYCGKHYKRLEKNGVLGYQKGRAHNMAGTPEHRAWAQMNYRCYAQSCGHYAGYGGRGIRVCDRWKNSFPNFFEDMGKRPTPEHSLDRIDNNGNYEPNNCRWATRSQQGYNRRATRNTSGHVGVCFDVTINKWKAYLGKKSLGTFIEFEDAVACRKDAEGKLGVGAYGN